LKIPAELRTFVVQRANLRCEYCLIHQDDAAFSHEVDHVISRQHGGETVQNNLAFACMVCNRYKGANIGSVAASGIFVPLFNPRESTWAEHFRLNGAIIEPLDVIGEVTARVLRLNAAERVVRRSILQQLRRYPRV
jgi:hypothetical protein